MKVVCNSNENEMIYEFLKMELSSSRYSKKIINILNEMHLNTEILIKGNIVNMNENIARKEILGCFRGYGENRELFERFPINIEWKWTLFDRDDLDKTIYINYSYWNELSNYTGSPIEAARTILSGKTIYDVPNDGFIKISQDLNDGQTFPSLIMLTDEYNNQYIILEGHKRMTAYGLNPELFSDISVLLGFCNDIELKKWYGEMPSIK